MLKVRIIPTLLWKDFGLVKGNSFNSWRRVGSVMPAIKVYKSRDVDELMLFDIIASQDNSEPDHESIEDFSEECSVPLSVGGGVCNLRQILSLLHAGADKVSINTAAYNDINLIGRSAHRFGTQCIVSSIDVRKSENGYSCYSHAGTTNTNKDPVLWAKTLESEGAGEILLTSIDQDGTMGGYDLHLIESVASAVNIPVIASGGAGSYQHMIDAVNESGASAVAAASIFHFTELTPAGAKSAMYQAGIPVRNNFILTNT